MNVILSIDVIAISLPTTFASEISTVLQEPEQEMLQILTNGGWENKILKVQSSEY